MAGPYSSYFTSLKVTQSAGLSSSMAVFASRASELERKEDKGPCLATDQGKLLLVLGTLQSIPR